MLTHEQATILQHRAKEDKDFNGLSSSMHEEYSRMRNMLSRISDPIERWYYIVDNTHDTAFGVDMCDQLIRWAERLSGGVEKPRFKSDFQGAAREHGDTIMERLDDNEDWETRRKEEHNKLRERNI